MHGSGNESNREHECSMVVVHVCKSMVGSKGGAVRMYVPRTVYRGTSLYNGHPWAKKSVAVCNRREVCGYLIINSDEDLWICVTS